MPKDDETSAVAREALNLAKRTVKAAQTFRVAAQAATFGDEIRPTKELVEAVNQLFASLPSPQSISHLKWLEANTRTAHAPQAQSVVEAVRDAIYEAKFGKTDPRERGPDAVAWAERKALAALSQQPDERDGEGLDCTPTGALNLPRWQYELRAFSAALLATERTLTADARKSIADLLSRMEDHLRGSQ